MVSRPHRSDGVRAGGEIGGTTVPASRRALAAAVFAAGALLSCGAFALARRAAGQERALLFERRATQVAHAVQRGFDAPLEVLRSVPSLFEASDRVSRAEFRAFVRAALARHLAVYALEWIPRVPAPERARYEASAVADGVAGFRFVEDGPLGRVVPAAARDEYHPLFYMEPPNATALGLEETALASRRRALERARDTADLALSERLRLVQDDADVASVIAFAPVFGPDGAPATVAERRRDVRGYAAAVLRIRPVVEAATRELDLGDVELALLDEEAPEPQRVIFESAPGAARPSGGALAWTGPFQIGGRAWAVRVRESAAMPATTGWSVLALGLLVSALAAAGISAADVIRGLRRQVHAARTLGQYTLGEKLGEGGMGAVYEAHHAMLRRPTAIKLLSGERAGEAALARFEREVQLTSRLGHPNTVVVHDYGRTPDGTFYYAMEHIDGLTLEELVRSDGPLPPARAIHVLEQVCASLAEAHAIGLVHRDVKPANVMLCVRGGVPDFVKVLDFGLAKELSGMGDAGVSQSSAFLGTPLYAAPEAITAPASVDARADLYALGAVACFLLTGEPPFGGGSVVEVCARHVGAAPEPPSARALGIPPALDAVVLRCLEKDPARRFASADELRVALAAIAVAPWSRDDAAAWWRERGDALTREVRERARRAADTGGEGRRVVIDPRARA